MKCPMCNGQGEFRHEEVTGCISNIENMPIIEDVGYKCEVCNGKGWITKKQMLKLEQPGFYPAAGYRWHPSRWS